MGTYTENLKSGGVLNIFENNWTISHYYPGPDYRYNGTFHFVPDTDIDEYIEALNNNFLKYLELKSKIPDGGQYSTEGEYNMHIDIGGYNDGICNILGHSDFNTQEELDVLITDCRYAKEKAEIIMKLLNSI